MTRPLRIGSLCSGIGGLELGLEWAGVGRTVWQAEVDPHASSTLARWWPDVPNHGDVRAVPDVAEPVDLICAGYPCQPFSTAGRRKGTDDDRHMWPAVRDAVRHLGPSYVVLENVRGHLSLGFGDVLGDLADLGFDAEWGLFRASDIGAPHRRERVFIVARHPDRSPEDTHPKGGRPRHSPGEPGGTPADTPDLISQGTIGGRDRRRRSEKEARSVGPPTADTPDLGHERRRPPRDRRPGPTDRGHAPADPDGIATGRDRRSAPRPQEQDGHEPDQGHRPRHGRRADPLDWGPYAAAVGRWEHTLGRPAPAPTIDGRLAPAFVEWMMGFPEGWTDHLGRTAALRCLGNAVVPHVAKLAWETL